MTDSTLNRFLAGDTNATRTGFTPSVPTPASGPGQGYLFYERDTNTTWLYNTNNTTWYPHLGGGVLSPAAITVSQNNYSPAGLSTCTVLRLTSTGPVNITGLTAPATGQQLVLISNIGSNTITLTNEDASSTAANRFDLTGNTAIVASQSALLFYDTTSSRWRSVFGSAGAGTVTSVATDGTYLTGGPITASGTVSPTTLTESSVDSAQHRLCGGI